MNSVLALWKREYLEHRGAFLYTPAIILGVITATLLLAYFTGRNRMHMDAGMILADQAYEIGFFFMTGAWSAYLLLMLFFYFADAFSADRRNNAMFFWKSMPQTDLKILANKFFAGTIVFPGLILGALVVTGVILAVLIGFATILDPSPVPVNFGAIALSFVQILGVAVVYFALAMLWYAPFFAWVGGLSTLVGRWSIPLAFVIPALLILLENVLFFGEGPRGGYIYRYLSQRLQYGYDGEDLQKMIFSDFSVDAGELISLHLSSIDWTSMGIGLVVAAALVYAASEYRRRIIGN
jgi:ABC-2 type transport system permease protein